LIEYLDARDELPDSLCAEIAAADSRQEIEQLVAIYKRNRKPGAMAERAKVLAPLADRVLDGSVDTQALEQETSSLAAEHEFFSSAEDAQAALQELIVTRFAQSMPVRKLALSIIRETGKIDCRRFEEAETATDSQTSTLLEAAAEDATVEMHPTSASSEAEAPTAETAMTVDPSSLAEDADRPQPMPTEPPAIGSATRSPLAPANSSGPSTTTAAPAKPAASMAEQRRQRRKESRLRRRAHLESALKVYFGKAFPLAKLTTPQYADIDFGERVRVLTATMTCDDQRLAEEGAAMVVPKDSSLSEMLIRAWYDARQRFIIPDCERLIRREFADQMERQTIAAIKRHVRDMCMQRPIKQTVLAVVGHRDGFSLAVLDPGGSVLLAEDLPRNDVGPDKLNNRLKELAQTHAVGVLAIADSPRTRLIEQLAANALGRELADLNVGWLLVAANGLDAYAKSATGCEEIPAVTPEKRAAIALARRAQDPLCEFVKCGYRDWLSEKQQTTIDVKRLGVEIERVYQSCVGRVGVDVNTATPAVLQRVSGLDDLSARKIENYRIANGKITSIENLREVLQLDDRSYQEARGFLRVVGGDNALDAVGIHPEHYAAAESTLAACGLSITALAERLESTREQTVGSPGAPTEFKSGWEDKLRAADLEQLSQKLDVGKEQLRRIINALRYAGSDIRTRSTLPIVRHGSLSLPDLAPGQLYSGKVVNVAGFGAFVELAHGVTGLVHISRLGDRFVRDPRELLMVGERIPVWVVSVDRERQRIALSVSAPGKSAVGKPKQRTASKPRISRRRGEKPVTNRAARPKQRKRESKRKKVVAPITDAMKDGREPMRTFGDLKQFFDIERSPDEGSEKKSADENQAAKDDEKEETQ
jgi:uncharacterized protein